jgi:hypothetical protein
VKLFYGIVHAHRNAGAGADVEQLASCTYWYFFHL